MIFIPEKYIFIIGGKYKKEIKEVLIYKIKEENYSYEKYPHLLPYELLEPSLIMINNKFLYAFENSKEKFKVVKCNVTEISPFEDINMDDYIRFDHVSLKYADAGDETLTDMTFSVKKGAIISTTPSVIIEPANAASIITAELTELCLPITSIMTNATVSFAPEDTPSTNGPAIGL